MGRLQMMKEYIMALDQGTTSSRCILFDHAGKIVTMAQKEFTQIYPQPGWVEQNPREIWSSQMSVAIEAMANIGASSKNIRAIGITNQRETTIVWDKKTGEPVYNAIVWQCRRTAEQIDELKEKGYGPMLQKRTGLVPDAYFSASKIAWILDHVKGAREAAEKGELLFGTVDTWLIWNLTKGAVHVTDYTNASRTLLLNIHTMLWDNDLLELFTIPKTMMPELLPCDAVFGKTTVGGLFKNPIVIAGVLGDSHGALTGQMCFEEGLGKVTYGTGSSVMVNIGEKVATAPRGLVTSIGFAALGKVFYAFEGNIHCTGGTIKWLEQRLQMIGSPDEAEELAVTVEDNGGVYVVPAFAGLGAPWWQGDIKAAILGMTLGTGKPHVLRAALESIAYQVNDLVKAMTTQAGIKLKEIRVDGGPTKNKFLMQFQADCLRVPINCSDVEEASALGAVVMNGMARKIWTSFEQVAVLRRSRYRIEPQGNLPLMEKWCEGWLKAVNQLIG